MTVKEVCEHLSWDVIEEAGMKYKMKLWLNKNQYLAVLDEALVIVTVDNDKQFVKAVMFLKED